MKLHPLLRSLAWSALAFIPCTLALFWWLGGVLAAGSPSRVGSPPAFLPADTVRIHSESGSRLSGWFAPGRPGHGGVLLLHGSRGDRRSMLGRARFLHGRGHAMLLIDLQAHGESPGQYMTSGYLESRDADAALQWLRQQLPGESLGIVGFSLGGAAALLGSAAQRADALVLEAVYTEIGDSVGNRLAMSLGPTGRWLSPLLLLQLRPRLGIHPESLAPVERVAELQTPLLVVGGELDMRATAMDTRRLFAAAKPPKTLWLLPGAAHQDFHSFDRAAYEQKVGGFLARHLISRR